MNKRFLVALVTLLSDTCLVWAAPVINVGQHALLPNTPNQPVEIWVEGGDPVQGLNFNIQVYGPEPRPKIWWCDAPPLPNPPTHPDVDIFSGTIFSANNTGTEDLDGAGPLNDLVPYWEGRSTTTGNGTVNAAGRLATIYLDTRGLSSGTWDLRMSNTDNGGTNFAGVTPVIADGTLNFLSLTKSWNRGAGTPNWGDANNWNPSGVPDATNNVTFGNTGLAPNDVIELGAPRSVQSLIFDSTVDFTIGGSSGGLTLEGGTLTRSPGSAGTQTIAGGLIFGASGTCDISGAGQLTISGSMTVGTAATLTKTGTGTLMISGPQDWGAGSCFQIGSGGDGSSSSSSLEIAGAYTVLRFQSRPHR